jgi:hypothetical protein
MTKFKKFEPLAPSAKTIIEDFLKRGGVLILETKSYVEIRREASIAKIDQQGRVEWRQG